MQGKHAVGARRFPARCRGSRIPGFAGVLLALLDPGVETGPRGLVDKGYFCFGSRTGLEFVLDWVFLGIRHVPGKPHYVTIASSSR